MVGCALLLLGFAASEALAASTVGPLHGRIDGDRDAAVSSDELSRFREALGAPLDPRDAEVLVRRFDADGTGTLGLAEFTAWVDENLGPPDQDERDRMFGIVDDDGDERARPGEIGGISW